MFRFTQLFVLAVVSALILTGCVNGSASVGDVNSYEQSSAQTSNVTRRVASREFAGPTEFPPQDFAAYGLVAFPQQANPERMEMFCEAYIGSFSTVATMSDRGIDKSEQMVTVWPLRTADAVSRSTRANMCSIATSEYGYSQARIAMAQAQNTEELTDGIENLSGRGPFLLAWSPGVAKNRADTIVLVANLSNSSTPEQAKADFSTWTRDIQMDKTLWRKGWNRERVRLAIQRWADRRPELILKLLGAT